MTKTALSTIVAAAGFVALSSAAALAGVAVSVEEQPSAPVHVTKCSASIRSVNNGWGTHYLVLDTGVSFRNDSPKTAVAVLVRFHLTSVFGDAMGDLYGQSSGQFSAGVVIDGNTWTSTDTWPGLGVVDCSISRVVFADGLTWKDPSGAGTPATPTPSQSPSH